MRSVERGLEILQEYINNYPDDPDRFIRPEIRFKEEIMDEIFYEGRIDGVFRNEDGLLAVDEDKTASRLGDYYFNELRHSYQVLWYLWIAKKLGLFEIYGEQNPICLMNAIYINSKQFRFERQIAIKTKREVDASFVDLCHWIRMIQMSIENNLWPRANSNICLMYGGCDYLPLRNVSEKNYQRIVEASYQFVPVHVDEEVEKDGK